MNYRQTERKEGYRNPRRNSTEPASLLLYFAAVTQGIRKVAAPNTKVKVFLRSSLIFTLADIYLLFLLLAMPFSLLHLANSYSHLKVQLKCNCFFESVCGIP